MTTTISSSSPKQNGPVYHHALRAVLWAMGFNFGIAAFKLYLATSVSRSASLFSEGMHSLADGLNSITLLVGILQGKKSPDKTHPFGYGLETNLWALIASFVLLGSAFWAVYMGIDRLTNPDPTEQSWLAILVLSISVVAEIFAIHTAAKAVLEEVGVEASWLTTIPRSYLHIRNVVSPTTRFVFYEDNLALLGALVALIAITGSEMLISIGLLTHEQAHIPDAIGSMIIGGLLMFLSINLFRHNSAVLTGSSAPANVESRIKEVVLGLHGVSAIHDLKTINHGIGGLFVHMKVEVDPHTPVKDVDDLTERIKQKLQARIPNVGEMFIEVLADESKEVWEERFERLIHEGQTEEVLKPREVVMLRNLYEFTETVVGDIMIPRIDIISVATDTPLTEVADLILSSGHSRIPVYDEDRDNVVGFVHARDVFKCLLFPEQVKTLTEIMSEITVYPENKPLSDLLEEFKRHRTQFAAVADEHGGIAGIVTIEDLLEEIVGEIWDESDVTEQLFTLTSDNEMDVMGKCEIYDLNSRFALNIPDKDFVTIGGFVFGLLGREPEEGDTATFEELLFTVQEVEGHRIVRMTISSQEPFKSHEEAQSSAQAQESTNGRVLTLFPSEKPEDSEAIVQNETSTPDNPNPKQSTKEKR